MAIPKIYKNIIDILIHFFTTIIFSIIIYLKSGNLIYAAIFVSGGIFLDLDHLIDHFIFAENKLDFKGFLSSSYIKSGKVYVFLHSWELNLIICLLGMALRSEELLILSSSITLHLVIDNIPKKNLLVYFLLYRVIKKFDVKVLLPEGEVSSFSLPKTL